jgi:hypothetical protein
LKFQGAFLRNFCLHFPIRCVEFLHTYRNFHFLRIYQFKVDKIAQNE